MSRLDQISLLSKPSPSQDFELSGVARSAEIVARANAWLQVHLDSDNEQTVTLAAIDGVWWLMRGAWEAGTDRAGRPLACLIFGRVVDELTAASVPQLLFGAFQQRRPAREDTSECEVALAPAKAANASRDLAARALQVLAFKSDARAVVDSGATAALVLEKLGAAQLDYVALLRKRFPARWPEGRGLVLSEVEWTPTDPVEAPVESVDQVDFAGLARLSASEERKRSLFTAALGRPLAPRSKDETPYEPDELEWLLRSPHGRRTALESASPRALVSLLEANALSLDDLDVVEARLPAEASRSLARLLAGRPDGAARLVARFGPRAEGLESLLDVDASRLWNALSTGTPLANQVSERAIATLEAAGLLDGLSKAQLLELLGNWLPSEERPSASRRLALLARCGLELSPGIQALCEGDVPSAPPSAADAELFSTLARAGAIESVKVNEAVRRGAPASWLRLVAPGAIVALLDVTAVPPVLPPREWGEAYDPLLARVIAQRAFWSRFQGQLSLPMLTFLAERAATEESGTLLALLVRAFADGTRLPRYELELVRDALPSHIIAEQFLAWCRAGAERDAPLALLLGSAGLRGELRDWLEAELLTGQARAVPRLSLEEMRGVLPLLHPLRDALRPLLSQPFDPRELSLIEPLALLLERVGVPPIAPPSQEQCVAHRELIARLCLLPGWAHWDPGSSRLGEATE